MQASSRRGSALTMQPIVFITLKTCVDTYGTVTTIRISPFDLCLSKDGRGNPSFHCQLNRSCFDKLCTNGLAGNIISGSCF
jgi:hypothetical protein